MIFAYHFDIIHFRVYAVRSDKQHLGENAMAGTRTAPSVTTIATTQWGITLHLVDASGDNYTDFIALLGTDVPALTEIEAHVAAYQAATQASVYKVTMSQIWEGEEDPDNAEVGQRNSVKDGVNLLWKNPATMGSESPRLVAPIATVMQGNQDIPLLTAAEFTALIGTYQVLLTGFSLISAQFTERRERKNNPRIKA